ncbi:MAG: YggS family pyridoxal phosphate-dependent enzyme [Pseudomonadota bacterium]
MAIAAFYQHDRPGESPLDAVYVTLIGVKNNEHVAANLTAIRGQIDDVARQAGRDPNEVRLIAVSKNHPAEAVAAAVAAGQRHFGESTIQDASGKISRFANAGLTWHFIGNLQSNKAKFLPGNFHWWHSLNSVKLAERVSRLAVEQSLVIDSLIEVNITGDPAKHGVSPDALDTLLDELLKKQMPGIRLRGLMGIGPHPASELEIRSAFAALRELRDAVRVRHALPDFSELSMGMSGDYVEAIREGSTMVRIGTAIFGERDYR